MLSVQVFFSRERRAREPSFPVLLRFAFLFGLVLTALVYPTDRSLLFLGAAPDRVANVIVVFFALCLVLYFCSKLRSSLGLILFIFLVTASICIRFFHYALVDFSGRGFVEEVFLHLDFESIRIAWY